MWLMNIRGILGAWIADLKLDLIMITESKLDSIIADNDPNINLTGYSLTRREREDDSGWGGCFIYYKTQEYHQDEKGNMTVDGAAASSTTRVPSR